MKNKQTSHIQVIDRLGIVHDYFGDDDLNFFCEGNNVRVYNAKQTGTIAQFNNYTKAEWIEKERKNEQNIRIRK